MMETRPAAALIVSEADLLLEVVIIALDAPAQLGDVDKAAERHVLIDGCEPPLVESRCGAVSVGRTYLFPPLSSGGALVVRPWLRFHIPLIEPDRRLSRIRLSDKTSRLRPRHVAAERGQAYEPEVPVEVREWISPAPASSDLVLDAQPP